jgi:hypothetical protein
MRHTVNRFMHGPLAALAVSVLLATALAGCYTLMRHPAPAAGASLDGGEDCTRCHAEQTPIDVSVYPWVEYYTYSDSPWINYYGAPWWHDTYWERCKQCDGTEASATSEGYVLEGRNGWGRRVRETASASDDADRVRSPGGLAPLPILSPPASGGIAPARPAAPDATPKDPKEEKEKPEARKRGIRR